MIDATQLLSAPSQGDPHAANRLLPLAYDELRKLAAQRMAREQPGQTVLTLRDQQATESIAWPGRVPR
jgi:hypothetical protein